ncbi:MAG TPA: DUF4249 domain-containing protein [Puia sp.]|nr:DUF4249 domain-containing protein [Puia sp.]
MKTGIRTRKIFIAITMACILLCDCVQSYVSPYKSPATGYLVVDGYITGNGATQYYLTRTIPLPGDSTIPVVTGAGLQVEGTDGAIYSLAELGGGRYGIDSMPLRTGLSYRLRIKLPGGESYLSDFVPYKPTPPIDSVNWIYDVNGVTIFVNTHDPANSTRYYQWRYDQTYEYHAAEASSFIYVPATNSIVQRTPAQNVYTCWMDVPVTNIVVGTSAKLSQDVIYEYPLLTIPPNSQPLSVEYSILVSQYALSDSGYFFLQQMARNNESLGSIFDALPSQPAGNIHSLTDPNEPVIGYIQAGTVQQQRIFISNQQVSNWVFLNRCGDPDIIVPNIPDSIKFYFGEVGLNPLYQNFGPSPPLFGWFANELDCTNCTLQGGTTQKPSFWPN